jgi:hypothetical protein
VQETVEDDHSNLVGFASAARSLAEIDIYFFSFWLRSSAWIKLATSVRLPITLGTLDALIRATFNPF